MAITSAEFLADVSSREKEKAREAKGNDLVFGQGLRRKARAISQTIKSQMTKHFTERKERKAARKAGRNKKTLLRVRKRERIRRATPAHLLARRINMANSSPSEEHVDAMEATAAGQDAWSEDYYWDSNYGCWVYFEQWDNQHESWNYFVHDGWDVRTGLQCNGVSTDFSIIGIMQCIIFLLEMSLHCTSLLIGYANFTLHQLQLMLIFVSQYFAVSSHEFKQPFSVHDERHFAEEGDDSPLIIRYNGSESSESYVRYNGSIKKTDEVRQYGHAFLNYESNVQHTLLTDYVDMSTNPTFVILDSGCTRAMGSRFAIDRLVKACMNHRYSHLIKFTKEASNNRFSFANGESSHVKEKLIIYLKNPKHPTGWVTTTVDILDKGRVPILFSVEQMRNLRMNIEHTPAGEFLTCPVFGLKRYALSVATSNHPILDVMFLARCGQKPEHSFAATNKITCPACNGKHRAHTYDEHCNLERPKEGTVRRTGVPTRKVKDNKEEVNQPASESSKPKQRLGSKKTPTTRQSEQEPEPVEPERSIAEETPIVEPSSGPKQQVIVEDDEVLPIRQKKDPKIKADLPLALKRIHEKLDSPVELYKLHLKHYHMSTEQFRKRTSALKIPEDIYAKYDLIVKQCDTCQKEKKGPSRSKISGMRSEVFGDLTFVDHAEIPLDSKYKLMFLIIYDGATQLMTSFPCTTKSESETIDLLLDYFDLY